MKVTIRSNGTLSFTIAEPKGEVQQAAMRQMIKAIRDGQKFTWETGEEELTFSVES